MLVDGLMMLDTPFIFHSHVDGQILKMQHCVQGSIAMGSRTHNDVVQILDPVSSGAGS